MGEFLYWSVDPQNDFMHKSYVEEGKVTEGKLYVPNAEGIIANGALILEKCIQHNIRIAGSADDHTPATIELWRNRSKYGEDVSKWPDHCMNGTLGQKHVPEFMLHEDMVGIVSWMRTYNQSQLAALFKMPQVILTKDANDVFKPVVDGGSPYIEDFLKTVEPGTTIIISGVATDFCVKDALRGWIAWAEKNGSRVILVTDAVKEIFPEGKEKVLEQCRKSPVFSEMTTKELLQFIDQKVASDLKTGNSKMRNNAFTVQLSTPQEKKIKN